MSLETWNWYLKNIVTGEKVHINKQIFHVGRCKTADMIYVNTILSKDHATLFVCNKELFLQDNKPTEANQMVVFWKNGKEEASVAIQEAIRDFNCNLCWRAPRLVIIIRIEEYLKEITTLTTLITYFIQSCNGTFVNNNMITPRERYKLNVGDRIGFGCNESVVSKKKDIVPIIFDVYQNESYSFSEENNSCIIISDDEEDGDKERPFQMSQMEQLLETVKKEPEDDCNNTFMEIKKELAYLDECDKEILIDLTEEPIRDTGELLNLLESPMVSNGEPKESNCTNEQAGDSSPDQTVHVVQHLVKGIEKLDAPHEDDCKDEKIDKNVDDDHVISMENVESDDQKDGNNKKGNVNDTEISRDADKIKLNVTIDKIMSKLPKDGKPTLITPHLNTHVVVNSTKNISRKRKSKDIIEITLKKKSKINLSKQSEEIKWNQNFVEERRKKLKALALKNKINNEPNVINKSLPKVKVSSGRGDFLLSEIGRCGKKPNGIKSMIEDKKIKTKSTGDTNNTNLNSNYPKPSVSELNPPLGHATSNFLQSICSTTQTQYCNTYNFDKYIKNIVKWPVIWLQEQKQSDIVPPVCGNLEAKYVPLKFANFNEYTDVMLPLVYLETWKYISEMFYNFGSTKLTLGTRIMHERHVEDLTHLDCDCKIPILIRVICTGSKKDELKDNNFNSIKTHDLALCELKLKDSQNVYSLLCFGYINTCNRINSSRDSNVSRVMFTITMSLLKKQICGKQFMLFPFANLASTIHTFKAISCLEKSPLKDVILNPTIDKFLIPQQKNNLIVKSHLNDVQNQVLCEALTVCTGQKPGIYVIQGPPGTGKSDVITNIVTELIYRSDKVKTLILLTAPSNAACDNLILKLNKIRSSLPEMQRKLFKMVRIGPDSSISKDADKYKLSTLAKHNLLNSKGFVSHKSYKEHVKSGKGIEEYLRKQLKLNYDYEMRISEDKLLLNSSIICTTLNSCVGYRLSEQIRRNTLKFTCCIIDEATQCNELQSLLPLCLRIDKFILVGDSKQLPGVVCSKEAQRYGYGKSLFTRFEESLSIFTNCPIRMLSTQYRMRPEICRYPNEKFYRGKLKTASKVCDDSSPLKPYLVFQLERINEESADFNQYINTDEIVLICKLLESLQNIMEKCIYSVGIITPYRAQVNRLTQEIEKNFKFNCGVTVIVNTVDAFQGMENDIVIISCVRQGSNNFVENAQRLNVALTRAKKALYIVGTKTLFKHCKTLYDLREDAKIRKVCLDIPGDPLHLKNVENLIKAN